MTDPTLDPDISAMLAATPPHPPYAEMGAEAARETFRQAVADGRGPGWQPEAVQEVTDRTVDGPGGAIPIRVYRPHPRAEALSADSESNRLRTVERLPVVVYFHGGGWTIGDLDTHDAQARMLCNAAGAVMVSVDYRLAPEHPYPAAFEDAVAAVSWAAAHAGEIHGDPARLAVAGDSAGGNLAAAVCLWARDHGGPPIAAQCLIYPVTDLHAVGGSWTAFSDEYNLAAGDMEWFNRNYAPDPASWDLPYLSPLRAADLSACRRRSWRPRATTSCATRARRTLSDWKSRGCRSSRAATTAWCTASCATPTSPRPPRRPTPRSARACGRCCTTSQEDRHGTEHRGPAD